MPPKVDQNYVTNSDGSKRYVDFHLPSYGDLTLVHVRSYLRNRNVNRDDLATAAGIERDDLNRQLNGDVPMDLTFMDALVAAFSDADLKSLAGISAGHVQTSGDLEDFKEFPRDEVVRKFARDARDALKSGKIVGSFSLRRVVTWARCYNAFVKQSVPEQTAFADAFRYSVLNREEGETADYYLELYRQIWGDLPVPNEVKKIDGIHPDVVRAMPFIASGQPVWLYGETGVGKSMNLALLSEYMGMPFVRFQCDNDSLTDDLIGGLRVEGGETVFQEGPLPLAMREGAVLAVDEISAPANQALQFSLHAVLEGVPLTISQDGGRVVDPMAGFTLAVCDNTRGLGEGINYVGTRSVNEAFRDRFVFVEVGHMPEDMELAIIEKETA